MPTYAKDLELCAILIIRLEKLSVDSFWAHRASGVRREMIRLSDELAASIDKGESAEEQAALAQRLWAALSAGFDVLVKGAQELPDYDHPLNPASRAR